MRAMLLLLLLAAQAPALDLRRAGFVAEDARDAADALSRIRGAKARGVSLIHLRLDSLPASATPGVPSEAGWAALDQVLAEAGRLGIQVLPSLASFRSGGGAQRLALGLGGAHEGLYLADGRAREWYLFVLQSAARRVSSVEKRPYRELPQLAGFSLAADLGDPADPEGQRALNWALRSAALLRREAPGKLLGLHVAQGAPTALGRVRDLDFLVLPQAVSAAAAALGVPALLAAPEGRWTPAPAAPALAPSLRVLDSQRAELTLAQAAPGPWRVDYGQEGLLAQSATAPAGSRRLLLPGLKAGRRYQFRASALAPGGALALGPVQALEIPGEAPLPPQPAPYSGNIIRAKDGRFWDGDRPYRYAGTNNYYIRYYEDKAAIAAVLDAARDMGLGVIRAQANGDRFEPMQPGLYEPMRHLVAGGPTGFQEPAFQRYDELMAEAAKRGLRVIVYITDNWEYFGGMKTWVRWRGLTDKNAFYTDERVKADYKGLMKQWATRINTVTGKPYKDDPALFAWELANECRNEADTSSQALAAWTQEMASYWKSLDPKHMVSTGLEGPRAHGGTHYSGADFETVQAVPAIDFACFHLYPVKAHLRYSLRAAKAAIRDYVRTAHAKLKKPVVMEEYSVEKKYDGELNRYEWISGMTAAFVDAGGDGFNHWMLVHDGYPGTDGHEIAPADTEYVNLMKLMARRMQTEAR